MSTLLAVAIAVVLLLILILCDVPIGFGLAAAGAVGIILVDGSSMVLSALSTAPYGSSASSSLLVLPMFILMGVVLGRSGIAQEMFSAAQQVVGRFPGGLGMATVLASTILGGISGSSTADAAAIGRVSIREMKRHGYPAAFSAAVVGAAGTVAILIPPSIVLILFGIITGTSIGKLLIAGIIPGVLMCLVFMTYVFFRSIRMEKRGEMAEAYYAEKSVKSWKSRIDLRSFRGVVFALVLFSVVLGGIYFGFFTSVEASAFGAALAIVMSLLLLKPGRDFMLRLRDGLAESAATSGMIFAILFGGAVFSFFLVSAGVPDALAGWITSLHAPGHLVIIIMMLSFIPLGMFLDGLSMMLITVPLYFPTVMELGYDPVWFGILVVVAFEIGLLTPPVGLNVFVIAGLPEAPKAESIFARIWPFVAIQMVVIGIFIAFPWLVTWLPNMANL